MPKLTRISTKGGDKGMTSLGSRQRVSKDAMRVRAYGAVDELNSQIGLAIASGVSARLQPELTRIQNELFNAGADLSYVEEEKRNLAIPQIESRHEDRLTKLGEELEELVGPLENFILPGGSIGAAQLQVSRAICRRAEREVVALSKEEEIGEFVIPYLNRLSDVLFLMARYENQQSGTAEPLWDSLA